jgi:hypothetical protein
MGGTTQRIGTTPKQTEGLRTGVIDYLSGRSGPNSPFGRITAAGPPAAAPWQGTAINRGMVRDVTGRDTQSVDQLGGANSAFFQNMMAQLQPAFTQQRQLASAAGSEAAGNLTGSGFANRLGSALGRSLGSEQAMLADYAFKGMGLEQQRQAGDADRALRGDMSNQGMDSSFINQLLQGDQNSLAARGQDVTMRGQDINLADANAQRFAGLLGQQAGLGVAPDEIIQKGGIGELLGPLGGMLGQGGVGSGILGQIFGGGGQGGGGGGILGGLTNVLTGNKGGSQVIGIGPGGTPIFAPVQQNGIQSVLSQIMGKGGLGGMIGSAGIGAATGGGLTGALGGMAGGRLLGGALGSLIPIPGVGTALGSALGGWAAPKIGGAVKKAGGWLGDRLGFNDQKKKPSTSSMNSTQGQLSQQQMQQLGPLLQMLFGGGMQTPPINPTFPSPGGYQQIPINPVFASA